MLRQLASEGLAVLLTEQNHRLALATADRAYFIEKGQIVWGGRLRRPARTTSSAATSRSRYLAVYFSRSP